MGQLKKTYLFDEERLINPEMINEAVNLDEQLEDRYKIGFKTM